MTISEPRLRSQLRQAQKVADAGKRTAAVQLYRQIIEEAPDSEDAWLGLAALLNNREERRHAFERVLALSPGNEEAQLGLARLAGNTPSSAPDTAIDPSVGDPFEQSHQWLNDATARSSDPANTVAPEPPPRASTAPPTKANQAADERVETAEPFHDLVCYRHANRETSLRCYSCGRPICSECAVKTPVGYRCPKCIREAEDAFFNAQVFDYIIAPLVSLPVSLLAGYLVLRFAGGGFLFIFLMLFVGGAIGGLIGRVTKRAVGRRRGRYLPHIVAATVVLGMVLPILFFLSLGAKMSLGGLLIPGLYLFVATSAAFHQMK